MLKFRLFLFSFCCVFVFWFQLPTASGDYLDDQFQLPPGFHIRRVAGPELTGGSYDIACDGQGRLLVGDGNAVRRLRDQDNDGIFDSFEVIATGLGPRGPQGLLVYGDKLYAIGGDGLQVFEGYRSGGPLRHAGRIGNKFNTGGDHDAHTLLRGHDGFIYLVCGDGAGSRDRLHITEPTSPVLFERAASVFRISPDGSQWECISAGGRNPPNLGQNYLGDFFSLDSDMEWHIGLPFYRPVRLNHWAIGGDQGWLEVGAYPPYYPDCLPGILEVGRGSPDWGIFYEHSLFPSKYRDAFFVCDYRWKSSSTDQYTSTGRLLSFFLKRSGGSWKASMEVVARPKPRAQDQNGKPIQFALVDVEVAPDGSLYLSEHNQGIWHLTYPSPIRRAPSQRNKTDMIDNWLDLPQPGAEWSRGSAESYRSHLGVEAVPALQKISLDTKQNSKRRLTAIRYLSEAAQQLPEKFIETLSRDPLVEIRAQAGWLAGLRNSPGLETTLKRLLKDKEPFVRKRAAEAASRSDTESMVPLLIPLLNDPDRWVRFVAMNALAHRPPSLWLKSTTRSEVPAIQIRGLLAMNLRRENSETTNLVGATLDSLCNKKLKSEDELDLLRLIGIFQTLVARDEPLRLKAEQFLLERFPGALAEHRWEVARLLGVFRTPAAFPKLLGALEKEPDPVTQFHLAQAISRLKSGWRPEEEQRLWQWILKSQIGWFAELTEKGVEFPLFWATALNEFAENHWKIIQPDLAKIDFSSILGGAVLQRLAEQPKASELLLQFAGADVRPAAQSKIIAAMEKVKDPKIADWLRTRFYQDFDAGMQGRILRALAAQASDKVNEPFFRKGLAHAESEVVRSSVAALVRLKPQLDEDLAGVAIRRMKERRSLFPAMMGLLTSISPEKIPGDLAPGPVDQKIDESIRTKAINFWERFYEKQFHKKLETAGLAEEKKDGDILRFILGNESKQGRAERGALVYENLQCHTCHGGGKSPGREGQIFGPELAGVTRRLTRSEFAESLVYPSKVVADRFKAWAVELADGSQLTGFITEQNENEVTLVTKEEVRRLNRKEVKTISPQQTSLMPDQMLNRLSFDEIRDLLAFMEEGTGGR